MLRRTALAAAALSLLLALTGCGDDGGGGEGAAPAATRGEGGEGAPAGGDYCERAEQLVEQGSSSDPEESLAQLASLREVAPEELVEPFEVIERTIERLQELDGGGGEGLEGFGDAVATMFDPEVLEATATISATTLERCGVDLEQADEPEGGEGGGSVDAGGDGEGFGSSGPAEIGLDDIEAVEEANAGEAWVGAVTGSSVVNGTDVELFLTGAAPGDALAACEALLAELVAQVADVGIEVLVDDEPAAVAEAGGSCQPA